MMLFEENHKWKVMTWLMIAYAAPSQPACQKVHAHTGSSLSHGLKNSKQFFYFPIEKSAPTTTLTRSSISTREIGLRYFASLVVERWFHKSPKPDTSQR
jgi:hypothetical protein